MREAFTVGGEIPFGEKVIATGTGASLIHTFAPEEFILSPWGRVEFFLDRNGNGRADQGESVVTSPPFKVLNKRVYNIKVDVSSKIAPVPTAGQISTIIGTAQDLLLERNSEMDFRAAVQFVTTTTYFTATPAGGARPDPLVSQDEELAKHFDASADIVFVDTFANNHWLGITGNYDWHQIVIEWSGVPAQLAESVAHEMGHGVGLRHPQENQNDFPRIMSALWSPPGGYNELTEDEADAFEK